MGGSFGDGDAEVKTTRASEVVLMEAEVWTSAGSPNEVFAPVCNIPRCSPTASADTAKRTEMMEELSNRRFLIDI